MQYGIFHQYQALAVFQNKFRFYHLIDAQIEKFSKWKEDTCKRNEKAVSERWEHLLLKLNLWHINF